MSPTRVSLGKVRASQPSGGRSHVVGQSSESPTGRITGPLLQCPLDWPGDADWTEVLQPLLSDQDFLTNISRIEQLRFTNPIFPESQRVFQAFRLCSFRNTKVVIVGQDPYHGIGQADGLAFSVREGAVLPPSLRNIFRELYHDLGCLNQAGDLTPWAQQGVLLLNSVLTVEQGQPHSHRGWGWEQLTDLAIARLAARQDPAVFVLWGQSAAKKMRLIGHRQTVLCSAHPSPLSAYRGFFESRPFSAINQQLAELGYTPIDWQL